jgi:hypothetical protein
MRTRFSIDNITEINRLTDELKIAARDIAKKFCSDVPSSEPWEFDLSFNESTITLMWDSVYRGQCYTEEFDIRYEWFNMTDEELDELIEEEKRRKEQAEKNAELNRLKTALKLKRLEATRIEEQIEEQQRKLEDSSC